MSGIGTNYRLEWVEGVNPVDHHTRQARVMVDYLRQGETNPTRMKLHMFRWSIDKDFPA